jgi:hypothetical protein
MTDRLTPKPVCESAVLPPLLHTIAMRWRKQPDAVLRRLHAAPWSVREAGFTTATGFVWQLDATNGRHVILAWAETQAAAWRLAAEQAAAVGTVRR